MIIFHVCKLSSSSDIVTIARDSWDKTSTFSSTSSTGTIYALALSPNGVYLASSTNKEVHVWSTQTRRLLYTLVLLFFTWTCPTMIFRFPNATTEFVTQIAFSPTRNLLAWTDFAGSLYRWSDPIPSSSPSPVASVSTSLTRPIRRGPTPTLFDDGVMAHKSNPQANEDIDLRGADDFENDDWILDDVGDGMVDDVGAQGDGGGEFVKEMGMGIYFSPPKSVLTLFTSQ